MRWDDLADMVGGLTPGCAFWRDFGGPYAWSEEVRMMSVLELRIREMQWQNAGDKNAKKPEPWEPPPFKGEKVAEQKVTDRRAELFLKRQGVR